MIRRHQPDAIYDTKPTDTRCQGKNFILKGTGGTYYWFVHNLSIRGDHDVTVEIKGAGPRTCGNFPLPVSNIEWVDMDEQLEFTQDGGQLSVNFTGYDYGVNWVVRVARIQTTAN